MTTTERPGETEFIQIWNVLTRGVSAAQHTMTARAEAAGISAPYVPVLLLLLDAEERRLPMSRIARDLAMTSGGFTKLADRMARDGLIDRRGSSGDRRVVFAALTADGLALADRAGEMYVQFLRENVLSALSAQELRHMAELSERLRAANEPADSEAPGFVQAPRSPDAPDRRARSRDGD